MTYALALPRKDVEAVYTNHVVNGFLEPHQRSIEDELKDAGADAYDLLLPETHLLPLIIQPDETIIGIVYGRYKKHQPVGEPVIGRGALVATDKRVLLVDKKPGFYNCDDIAYRAVSAVSYTSAGPAANVELHTRLGDIDVRTFNKQCGKFFSHAVETKLNEVL